MEKLLKDTAEHSIKYLTEIGNRKVTPTPEAINDLKNLDFPFPENSSDPKDVIGLLNNFGSPATMASAGGRFFGFVIGGSLPSALAANWLTSAWDQNGAFSVSSPISAAIEDVAIRWLKEALFFPSEFGTSLVTGTTMANFTSLAAARNFLLNKEGWNIEAKGLYGAPELTVMVGEEVHPTLLKGLGLLGLGRERVITIPVDDQGRMMPDKIPNINGPTIVCTQAGNVNTGAFDPISEICDIVKPKGAWVHVDGAFGLWAAASPNKKHLIAGYEKADSWATDLHKWLNVPYDNGAAFVRYPESLLAAMSLTAAYIPDTESREPFHYTPEVSRRARGIEVWAAMNQLGRKGLSGLVDRCCLHAQTFAEKLSAAGFEILNDVVLNQVLVSFGTPEKTLKVINEIQLDGTCWCGGTVWQNKTAMRISISSWATTGDDVQKSVEAIIRIANNVAD